jgi:hypothetical protein
MPLLMGFLVRPGGTVCSRNLRTSGPYGSPLDLQAYATAFDHV